MRSPICLLALQIAGSPFNVAPEKASLCAQLRDEHKIQFLMVDEPMFGVRVRLDAACQTPEIVLPIASLEYLWAFSHYCWVLTQEYTSAQLAGAVTFDCVRGPRLSESVRILQWARENLMGSGKEPWPAIGPSPGRHKPGCDDARVATELFLCSLAWILHHEIGHVVLRHPLIYSAFSEQEERAADRYATNWLLEGMPKATPETKKRALGIAIAVLCLQSLEIGSVACLRNTHPAAHDRIFANTGQYEIGGEQVVEAFCTVVLQFLFQGSDIKADISGTNFSEILGDLLLDISRANR